MRVSHNCMQNSRKLWQIYAERALGIASPLFLLSLNLRFSDRRNSVRLWRFFGQTGIAGTAGMQTAYNSGLINGAKSRRSRILYRSAFEQKQRFWLVGNCSVQKYKKNAGGSISDSKVGYAHPCGKLASTVRVPDLQNWPSVCASPCPYFWCAPQRC